MRHASRLRREKKLHGFEGSSPIRRGREFYVNICIEIHHEDVAEVVRRQLRIAAGPAERIAVGDDVVIPGLAAVSAPSVKQAGPGIEVRNSGDLQRVGVIDCNRGLGFIAMRLAGVNVLRGTSGRGYAREW